MSDAIFDLFRALADREDEYVAEGDTIMFTHHGDEHVLTLSHVPSVGAALRRRDSSSEWVPADTFIQREILHLPILARQIARALERKHQEQRIKGFIDGPAEVRETESVVAEPTAKTALSRWLTVPSLGSTQIIELMAPAGQGKTVLLEHLAIEAARSYQPNPFPSPLLLVVDLLGRYVGTIHDAVAGSLSNTYTFPGLTARDVAFCLRQRWLVLALDGFDELVARVGTREAFLRTKELVDDLEQSGTVILSARDTFFRLFEIDASIRTYLQPRRGSYVIKEFNLQPWGEDQGRDVFRLLGSQRPDADLRELLDTFVNDRELVFRPFFTIRLANAWIEGERFGQLGAPGGTLDRSNYVIRVFLEREVSEKWRSREDGTPLLSLDGHVAVLGAIAEEMWRSGAFSLTREEVELAGRIALNDLGLNAGLIEDLVARLPTHGVLSLSGTKGVKFLHESFFLYVLGQRLGWALARKERHSVAAILKAGELTPLVAEWAIWRTRKEDNSALQALAWLVGEDDLIGGDHTVSSNVGSLLGCAARVEAIRGLTLEKVEFMGEALRGVNLEGVRLRNCGIWMADLSSSRLENCEFENCRFSNILFDDASEFPGTHFRGCEFSAIEVSEQAGLFAPAEIASLLRQRGASVEEQTTPTSTPRQQKRTVAPEVVRCLDKFRRAKTWDVALDDMEERLGTVARSVVKIGLAAGVFRDSTRDTSGGRKTFFRFAVDRERLFAGQLGSVGDEKIDQFWNEIEGKFPMK